MDDVGPAEERCVISQAEDREWWKILTAIYREEQEQMGAVRAAFSERAVYLLKSNGRDRAE